MSDELMTPEQVCDYLQITKHTLYKYVEHRRIEHIKMAGAQLRFRRSAVDAWLDSQIVPVVGKVQPLVQRRRVS